MLRFALRHTLGILLLSAAAATAGYGVGLVAEWLGYTAKQALWVSVPLGMLCGVWYGLRGPGVLRKVLADPPKGK